ncbi:sugar transferase [Anaerobutyricum soehngenii]|uniref:sugar transferase n=1 Tax=Anaerobutyricum soehngenii TaxID=105843 RepID=UPI003A7F5545
MLPDGTHKTGIGDFIRRTSLDEFPQFFNVLRGVGGIIEPTEKKLDFTGFSLA